MTKGFVYGTRASEATINRWMDKIEDRLAESHASINEQSARISTLASTTSALDEVVNPPPDYNYQSPSVSLTGGGTYERGQSIADPTVSWSVSVDSRHPLVSQSLTGVGSIDPVEETGSHEYTGDTITTDTTKTMTIGDTPSNGYGGNSASNSTSWTFSDKRIWGVHANPSISSADLLTLNLEFSSGYTQTRYFDPSSQYIYFAWPESWGGDQSIFVVNNLPNTAWEISTISHTNQSGGTINYNVYRSTYLQSGSNIKVEVG